MSGAGSDAGIPGSGAANVAGASNAALRAARRSAASTAGPARTIITAVVIARPVSQPKVEVTAVKMTKRCRFSSTGAPAT